MPTFVASAYVGEPNATSQTSITLPAHVEGDLLIITVHLNNNRTVNTPAGWSLLYSFGDAGGDRRQATFFKHAGAGEPSAVTISASDTALWAVVAASYRDADTPAAFASNGGSSTSGNLPSVTVAKDDSLVLAVVTYTLNSGDPTWPSGFTVRQGIQISDVVGWLRDRHQADAGPSGTAAFTWPTGGYPWRLSTVVLPPANVAPNAPILLAPADGATLNPGRTNRFALEPSDPDPGDTISQTEWRYRPIGTTAWATVLQPQPITYWDSPAGTFTTGLDYEWQARTFDAAGEPGPWSTSGFFSTAPPPPGPIITEPTDGATIPTQSAIYRWSTPNQDAHEILVTDSTGAEHVHLGPLTNSSRSVSVGNLANGETYTFAIRVQYQGLWSEWVTVTNPVSFTPPATPSVAVDDFTVDAAILVRGDTSPPAGSEPPVTYFDVYRREATDSGDGIRRKAMLAPGAVFTDHLVRLGGVEYHYRVLAHGDNGTTAWSAWSGEPEPVYELLEGGSPSSTGGESLSGGPI